MWSTAWSTSRAGEPDLALLRGIWRSEQRIMSPLLCPLSYRPARGKASRRFLRFVDDRIGTRSAPHGGLVSMSLSSRRKLAVGATGLAVLAGAGGAYAATSQSSGSASRPGHAAEQKAFLDDLAGRLHVSRDQLDAAVKGAATDRIDAAVAAGRLTKDEGDRLKQRIAQANGLPLLGGPGFGRGGPGPGFGGPGPAGRGFGGGVHGPATDLGVTQPHD